MKVRRLLIGVFCALNVLKMLFLRYGCLEDVFRMLKRSQRRCFYIILSSICYGGPKDAVSTLLSSICYGSLKDIMLRL